MVNTPKCTDGIRYVVTPLGSQLVDDLPTCLCPTRAFDGSFVICPECGTAWGHLSQMWVPPIRGEKVRRS